MDISNILKRLRDDIKIWVVNNINALNQKIDSKVDSNVLPEVIDNALAQAKESGEFKGEQGVPGKDGVDGYTPVRGVDYWTEDDKEEIKSYIEQLIIGGKW
jgi:hypothetical protein